MKALSTRLGEIRVGNPGIREVDMGALASQGQRDEAAAEGAGHVGDLSTPHREPSPSPGGGLAGSRGPCYGFLFVR